MPEQYFTPRIEDLYVGYECELRPSESSEVPFLPHVIRDDNAFKVYFKHSSIRTPFLSKEQIEAEGWKSIGKSVDEWFEKEGSFDMFTWTAYKARLQYGLHDHRLRIFVIDTDGTEYNRYLGECKDINTLRTICKLLGV